ncbi:MAG: signal recognition particle protein [Deltaproteobacteria bacterium CG_4_10_14_3_um_filter_60_8]|nr:MAG: signal recognition particle protein [Desulfobacterales bacterium CG2_30_60_27]PIP44525.1 MAG: signal recognition particle protein [Deltaproteobacteria bacterium CG23_combo_of_CG06-09_8_20_14_all_60_8]PIY20465.1 MAG: signal recognition particle protein [Deltaproteobacteria bacterium CG_4_10_14_3_um_filter_60_8]
MFATLSEKLEGVFKTLRGHGKLTEANIQEAMREVRMALLEADVNFKVVKDFIAAVSDKAVGLEVLSSLAPGQQVIKVVHDELVNLLGGRAEPLNLTGRQPAAIMMVGLQGSGKTTTSGKLASLLKGQGRKPYLVPADVYRPAAIEQLRVLGETIGVPVHPSLAAQSPVAICQDALLVAKAKGYDTLILDTAGRLHIDGPLMEELSQIKAAVTPAEILFVADAMTGQDAVTVADKFNQDLAISGVVLTKMEGDARGGAALSIKAVTRRPIKFVGVGEGLDALEVFHPDRVASRILGMGDVLTLIEKAEAVVDRDQAEQLAKKLRKNTFTLADFRDQIQQVRKMGNLEQIMGMIPGMNKFKQLKGMPLPDERQFGRVEAIINSMTATERHKYQMIDASRRVRIAKGSGTAVQDVNKVIKSYTDMLKMMKKFQGNMGGVSAKGAKRKRPKGLFR